MKKYIWIGAFILIAYLLYQKSKAGTKKSNLIQAGLGYPSFVTDLRPENMPQAVIM